MRYTSMTTTFRSLATALLILCCSCVAAFAQTSYGTMAGSITDATGAGIAGADVNIVSVGTGEAHTVKATAKGGYIIESLGTGLYNVTVTAPTFSKTIVNAIQVDASVTTSVNATLKVGGASETIEVSSAIELLKTESGEVSATIGAKEISELPVTSLNAYALATTLPGIFTVTAAGFTNGVSFASAGARPRNNNFLIEGQDNNDAGISGQGLQPSNQEALQSVTFLVSGAQAEFGRGGGVISNLVYKSGTNSFHGAIWNRFLNTDLNAYNHATTYNGGSRTNFRENIFGYRIGGPIFHDKCFSSFRSSSIITVPVPF